MIKFVVLEKCCKTSQRKMVIFVFKWYLITHSVRITVAYAAFFFFFTKKAKQMIKQPSLSSAIRYHFVAEACFRTQNLLFFMLVQSQLQREL